MMRVGEVGCEGRVCREVVPWMGVKGDDAGVVVVEGGCGVRCAQLRRHMFLRFFC